MNTRKIAITVPSDLLDLIDEITMRRNISRSKFISLLLREKLQQEKNRHLRNEYDRIFSDKAICDEQLKTAIWFDGTGSKEGQEW